jgi:hypothetical protein
VREHSELAMALVPARELTVPGGDDGTAWPAELGEMLQQLVPQLEVEAARRSLRVDAATTNVVVLGMVLGMVLGLPLLDPVLRTSAVGTTPPAVGEAMVELIRHASPPSPRPLNRRPHRTRCPLRY